MTLINITLAIIGLALVSVATAAFFAWRARRERAHSKPSYRRDQAPMHSSAGGPDPRDLFGDPARLAAAVLERMTEGALFVDSDGRVVWLNRAARALLLDGSSGSVPSTFAELVRHHEAIDTLREALASGTPQSATFQTAIEGRTLAIEVMPLGDPLPGLALILVRDLTRMRQLERVRRDFVSNISHELRTPLASIKAITETLQTGALEDPGLAHAFLGRLDTELDSLVQIVQELLELSKIESGQVPLDLKPVSAELLLHSAAERLRLQAARAGLDLQVDIPEGLPEVLADRSRLEQVLVNLLHNAIKFTPAGGQLRLEARPDDTMLRFAVCDTGIGISNEAQLRIFERFYKADRSRSGGGTGLGLAIARHLVEAHGGRIWVESTEGRGATFYFTTPIAAGSAPAD